MPTAYQPLFPDAFLASRWANEYRSFRGSATEVELIARLQDWASKKSQKERKAEGAFVGIFFKQTWGYRAAGEGPKAEGYTCEPQYAVKGAGQGGGTGAADLALGYFDRAGTADTPQVLCEFKDVRSGLDKPQRRKGNDRSPVQQCADYLKECSALLYGTEPIQPTWGIVSDMNEFRLYWRRRMPSQYQRFVLRPVAGDDAVALLGTDDASAFQRFVFWRIFQREELLTSGGPAPLERLLTEQGVQERALEAEFYREYQAYREEVFQSLVAANPSFKGTRGKLVRYTQRFLDRCLFILFCEDMGPALRFPPNILREVLSGVSTDPDYDPDDNAAWTRVKKLFAAMRDGSPFRSHKINRFNGGLFAQESELEELHIPTRLFCAAGQGTSTAELTRHKKTLLFFSANYNFGVTGGTLEPTIGLYTLGRIFEQSITELEYMEAKAEGRASITELSKRKRDGVYYTPEWVTSYIVEETVGALLSEIRRRLVLDPLSTFTEEQLEHYRRARASGKKDKRYKTESVEQYLESLDRYALELDEIKVVDPACGSGAFLIQALDRLVNERRWLAVERERVLGTTTLFDTDAVTKSILSKNIYGVDINEESIEITRLALWLHTALPDRPLTVLDKNIRCGNSLIEPEFYKVKQPETFLDEERERINAFDWRDTFPEVFNRTGGKGGFDCVVGNPPYVKFQHFCQVVPAVAEYLPQVMGAHGPLYPSTQGSTFDMYLPFIERGISLLNENGRMGYIAPSVWLISDYGQGLRDELHKTRRLERWVDFKDYIVFEEAMTYTALQFYRGKPSAAVSYASAPNGSVDAIDWTRPDSLVSYSELPNAQEPWLLLPRREQTLIDRLKKTCTPLGELPGVIAGLRGVESGADEYYQFHRLGPGRWVHAKGAAPKDDRGNEEEIELEDDLLRPLVSGPEARRYVRPITETYVLFPYDITGRPRLICQSEMKNKYPLTWAYLLKHERALRNRDRGKMNRDSEWWGYTRPMNMDKHKLPKLGVAQTVPEMRVFYDEKGTCCFNNVRVGGIVCTGENNAFFLMGVLNSSVVDFVFRRSSKPKERRPSGAYFEANKQFLEPLPIPQCTANERAQIVAMAQALHILHTARRDTIVTIDKRLASDQLRPDERRYKWLWADIGDVEHWTKQNPEKLTGRALVNWAKQTIADRLGNHLAELGVAMPLGAAMCAVESDGELMFFVGDRCVISGVYVSEQEAPLILSQWRQKARDTFVSDSFNARRLVDSLLDLKTTENAALIQQLKKLNVQLDDLEKQIRSAEQALDDFICQLFGLSESERHMVEADTRRKWNARMPMPPAA